MGRGAGTSTPGSSSSLKGKAAPAADSSLLKEALRVQPLETKPSASKPGEGHTEMMEGIQESLD